MEQQLAAVNWKPDDFEKHIRDLEQLCRDKDRQINELQAHVEEQVGIDCLLYSKKKTNNC